MKYIKREQIGDKIFFECEGKLTKDEAKYEQIKQGYYPQGYDGPFQVTYHEVAGTTTWYCFASCD